MNQSINSNQNHGTPTENMYHLECILITITKQIVAITSSVKSSYISKRSGPWQGYKAIPLFANKYLRKL